MKNIILIITIAFSMHSIAQSNCDLGVEINKNYSKAAALDSITKKYTTGLLPGVSVAVYSEAEGWWASAAGFANIEKKIPMQNCHLQYLQSISKSYMAVEILQLKEKGKIRLDDPVTKYLPSRYSKYIKNAANITVRMLLNQRSGIPEYNSNPQFVSEVILHPLRNFNADNCLKVIADQEPNFAPGTKYEYTNTNYLLLSLIGDALTGDHAAYIRNNIFKPLGLNNSYYANNYTYLKGLNITESYWDVLNSGKPANISGLQQMTVISSKGDDGIVCTTVDVIKFLKGVIEHKLLNEESMKEMLEFIKDDNGNPRYGMGMIYFDLGGIAGYGHGGGGIGAGCGLIYVPSKKIYTFFSTNLGVLAEGELVRKADEMKNAILVTLLK